MIELLAAAFATPGIGWLYLGVVLAGLVRGFAGFGTGMVYLPIAAQVLPPVWTLVTLIVIDIFGPLPAVPRALRDGHPRDVLRLSAGALVSIPLGVWLLTTLPAEPFRIVISGLSLVLLVLLVSGLRYHGPVPRPAIYGIGAVSGALAGAFGLGGPPVILLYMARPLPAAVIRASTLLFLLATDAMLLGVFGLSGLLSPEPLVLGLALMPVYLGSVMAGSAIFDPARDRVYRWTAYAIIAASAIGGLPLFD